MGCHFPSPGDLPDPGIEPGSPTLQADALTSEPPGKPRGCVKFLGKIITLTIWTFVGKVISLFFNTLSRASLIAQSVKNLPTMQETQVRFLGLEDSLEKEMAINSSILAWRIPWIEELGKLLSMRSQESDMT